MFDIAKTDHIVAICRQCHHAHPIRPEYAAAELEQWRYKHRGHSIALVPDWLFERDDVGFTPNASIKEAFGTSNQTITLTTDSLAASLTVGRASTAVDNSSNLFLEAWLFGKLVSSGSAAGNSKGCYVYAYGTADGGTTYTDGVTGTDAGFTRTDPPNLIFVKPQGFISMPATTTTYKFGPFSMAMTFGMSLPDHWGIAAFNDTAQTLGTGGGWWYQGQYYTSI